MRVPKVLRFIFGLVDPLYDKIEFKMNDLSLKAAVNHSRELEDRVRERRVSGEQGKKG